MDSDLTSSEELAMSEALSEKQRMILEKKALAQLKQDQQEAWRRIVVKVISWSDGLLSGGIIKKTDKITKEEWKFYYERCIQIGVNNKNKALQSLEETKEKIKSFGGFAD